MSDRPVVVVMGDAPASLLDRLAVLPDDVQILVIGDADGVDDWVGGAGEQTAAVDRSQVVEVPTEHHVMIEAPHERAAAILDAIATN